MNIHHIRPRLLLSPPRYLIVGQFAEAEGRQYLCRGFTANALQAQSDNLSNGEQPIVIEEVAGSAWSTLKAEYERINALERERRLRAKPVRKLVHGEPQHIPPRNSNKPRTSPFSDSLHAKMVEKHAAMKLKNFLGGRKGVVLAAKSSISRDHANQQEVLQTLSKSIVVGKNKKGIVSKLTREKRKSVDTSTLFEGSNFTTIQSPNSDTPSPYLPVEDSNEGWKSKGWLKDGWGNDELAPSIPELKTESIPSNKTQASSPHQQSPLAYIRRIEGLLLPKVKPTLEDLAPPSEQKPIAKLAHGLDRVLFNPGVHWLQDPRSGVYNFTTWLESIPNVKDFAFDRITGFVRSSADEDLWKLAKQEGRKFTGSTSSLSGMLSHVYFLLSGFKDVDTRSLSRHFQDESRDFTVGQRMPTTVIMNYNDGIYAFDSAPSDLADMNVLLWMGTMLEKFLTLSEEEFNRYLLDAPEPTEEEVDRRREAFRFSKSERFVMRSQLDGVDNRLPGTGVFDIKTRAALPIRLDLMNHQENSGYLIKTLHGPVQSFEKEYYDLIRSAFLKYSFQARIGNMDGVIVAYHNTARLFGFQYIPLDEMDECLFGKDKGDRVFQKCVGLLEEVADEMSGIFPEKSVKCTLDTSRGSNLQVWIEPLEWKTKEPRPVVQLDVEVANYLDGTEVSGSHAVSAIDPWTVHWSISRSSLSASDIRDNLAGAHEKQHRAWSLPSGVGYKDMRQLWPNLKFGSTSKDVKYKSCYFRRPSENILQLRQLARAGREETQRLTIENAGKRKVVWGVADEVIDSENMEGREILTGEDTSRDIAVIHEGDVLSVTVVKEPANSELERGLEVTESDDFLQEVVFDSDEIQSVLDGVTDETIDAGINSGPIQSTMLSDPVVEDTRNGVSAEAANVALESSTTIEVGSGVPPSLVSQLAELCGERTKESSTVASQN